jgi:hypothetical protein
MMQSFVCDNFFRDALTPPKFSSMCVGCNLLTLVMDSHYSKDQGIKLEYSQYWGNSANSSLYALNNQLKFIVSSIDIG